MSTLFVSLACLIALCALPHLIVIFFGQLASSLGMLSGMLFNCLLKVLTYVLRAVVWVLKLPLTIAEEIVLAFIEWGKLFKKGVDSNKKKTQFRAAVRNKERHQKLANRYDEIFYEANSSLKALKIRTQSNSLSLTENADIDDSEYDIPTFLRIGGLFQTDHTGSLRRDELGLPISITVDSMFSCNATELEIVESTDIDAAPEAEQHSVQVTSNHDIPGDFIVMDADGYESDYDPTLEVI